MSFDYDVMPTRGKKHSNNKMMRECNNCGERTCIFYEEDQNYKVVCEHCDEEHSFKAKSMDEAMEKWDSMELHADCEYCPLGWEIRDHEGDCDNCGCMIHEDINWCKKTYIERETKSKEFEF